MKKQSKTLVVLALIIIIIGGIIFVWKNVIKRDEDNKDKYEDEQEVNEVVEKYVEELDDGTKLNISNKLNETKMLEGLKISNIQLTYKNGMSIIIADVENTTNGDIGLTPINLKLYDEQGNILETLDGLISEVKSGEKTQLNIGISSDYANAYDISIEKK